MAMETYILPMKTVDFKDESIQRILHNRIIPTETGTNFEVVGDVAKCDVTDDVVNALNALRVEQLSVHL
jgi:hypothetical protein